MNVRQLSMSDIKAIAKLENTEIVKEFPNIGIKVIDSLWCGQVNRRVYYGTNTKMYKDGIKSTSSQFKDGQVFTIGFYGGENGDKCLGVGSEYWGYLGIKKGLCDASKLLPKSVIRSIANSVKNK